MSSNMAAQILASRAQIDSSVEGLQVPVLAAIDAGQPSAVNFTDSLQNAVQRVNAADAAASAQMADVDAGRSDDLVGAMLASQEASLSFSMLMQVRNKVMGAMDDLIKLPL